MSKLFSPIQIKDMTLRNRIVMPPMCMYCAGNEGNAKEWHYVHYISRAVGGAGLIIQEATAVESRGRISAADLGIWDDDHLECLSRIARSCQAHDAKIGIQLAHAGRKCEVKTENIIAPSALAFDENYKTPSEMTSEDIETVVWAFGKGAERARRAGYDLIEIHAAHGYLINEFLSPLTNKRTDEYGGSLENRARFLKEIIQEIRMVWPAEKPLQVRISAEEYVAEGNHPNDLVEVINMVKGLGVDIVDVSSGGVVPVKLNTYPGYQINYADIVKTGTGLPVIGGGLLSSAELAEEILQNGRADMVYIGRELLRNPYWPLQAAQQLGHDIEWPAQYERSKPVRR